MGRLRKRDIEELREFCSIGCEFSGTNEVIAEITEEILSDLGCTLFVDCLSVNDGENIEVCSLSKFIEMFWTASAERILNVVETQGK